MDHLLGKPVVDAHSGICASDSFWINYDRIDQSLLKALLHTGEGRKAYIHVLPTLQAALTFRRQEAEAERRGRALSDLEISATNRGVTG